MSLMSNCRWTDIRFLMNNFVKDFISLKIDHMQQEVHGTAQSSFTCKDKWSHRSEYKAEVKGAAQFTSKLLFLTNHLKITYFRVTQTYFKNLCQFDERK